MEQTATRKQVSLMYSSVQIHLEVSIKMGRHRQIISLRKNLESGAPAPKFTVISSIPLSTTLSAQ